MRFPNAFVRLRSSFARLGRDRRGISAVEFALLLPVMVLLYVGTVEISDAVAINRKVTLTANTIANIVSQYAGISQSSQMPDILQASSSVLQPFALASAKVTVSCVFVDNNGNATVTWSQALNTSPRTAGSAVTVPSTDANGSGVGHGLDIANSSLVLGEVSYSYTPQLGYVITGTLSLASSIWERPRVAMDQTTNETAKQCSIPLNS